MSLIASCGGSGGQQANKDATNDTPIGGATARTIVPPTAARAILPAATAAACPATRSATLLVATECESGFCVDGVCCNGACTDACLTCALQGAVGTCMPAYIGTDPRNQCDDMGAQSCGTTASATARAPARNTPRASFAPQSCTGTTLKSCRALRRRWRLRGSARPRRARRSCAAATASAWSSARTTAIAWRPTAASTGAAARSRPAPPAATPQSATPGFCEQGICCGTACTGTCRSCALPGSAGTCTAVPDGQDPLGQCADAMAATCDTDGFCDGKGGCRPYAAGTTCIAPSCAGSVATLAGRCDGVGACMAGIQQPCEPYLCGTNGQCRTSCTSNADCNGANVCMGGACSKRPNGMDCASGGRVPFGRVPAGRLLQRTLHGHLHVVRADRHPRRLHAHPRGSGPACPVRRRRPDQLWHRRRLQRRGRLPLLRTGSACGSQTCSGSTVTLGAALRRRGNCVAGASQSCTPYACGGRAASRPARRAPTARAETSARRTAAESSRSARPARAGSDCASGICAQGACCQTACTGPCMSCALTGTAGTCSTVPAGSDPLGQCADQGAPTCGTDGTCDGAGGCRCTRAARPASRAAARNRHTRRRRRATARARARRRPRRLRSLPVRHERHVPRVLLGRRGLRRAQRLHHGPVRQEGAGYGVRERRRMRLRAVPAGRLLQLELHGNVPLVRAGRQPRAPARRSPAGADPLANVRTTAPPAAAPTGCATAPAAAACTRRARCARRRRARA